MLCPAIILTPAKLAGIATTQFDQSAVRAKLDFVSFHGQCKDYSYTCTIRVQILHLFCRKFQVPELLL